jgi:hypothetical protein
MEKRIAAIGGQQGFTAKQLRDIRFELDRER